MAKKSWGGGGGGVAFKKFFTNSLDELKLFI